ncbi:phosphate signaling complex protein PhoU [Psychrobacter sp. LV10R520-6]|uniref:phosphate signaling complex protein PhoU n=1 Tax=Psychrobacter sp. LV10R520-6 TaxID=1415574 RepID=UPI0024CCB73A|nr:phosphate signaling complex protein PhoU [Psychrobacter sp. LV10R520-6]SNT71202.1 phosphate uptake regulator, PhoU [Psychrobacter sp. LV10R520-6]
MSNQMFHTSKSFDQDLTETTDLFLEMGALAGQQVAQAMHALIEGDMNLAYQVVEQDSAINQLEVLIDERVLLLVAKRQPAARDLRYVMAISKGVVDIERIGDEAAKIAHMAQQVAADSVTSASDHEVQHLSNQVRMMLHSALAAFEHLKAERAFDVMRSDGNVDFEYQSAIRALMTYVMEDPRQVSHVINLMWILRALERIGDHARNIAELVIYISSGTDVRHSDFEKVQQAIDASKVG